MEQKQTIIDAVRSMEVGDQLTYDCKQRNYIKDLVSMRLMPERREGKRWSVATDRERWQVTVTRTA